MYKRVNPRHFSEELGLTAEEGAALEQERLARKAEERRARGEEASDDEEEENSNSDESDNSDDSDDERGDQRTLKGAIHCHVRALAGMHSALHLSRLLTDCSCVAPLMPPRVQR